MSHRIDIALAVGQAIDEILDDPDGRDVGTERDDLLAVIYAWHQEQLADLRRSTPAHDPAEVSAEVPGTAGGGER
jgi:hypothetical protein